MFGKLGFCNLLYHRVEILPCGKLLHLESLSKVLSPEDPLARRVCRGTTSTGHSDARRPEFVESGDKYLFCMYLQQYSFCPLKDFDESRHSAEVVTTISLDHDT